MLRNYIYDYLKICLLLRKIICDLIKNFIWSISKFFCYLYMYCSGSYFNQTGYQAEWLINRPIRDYQLYRDSTHSLLIGFTNIAACRNLRCLSWTQHNTWTFQTKIINDLTLTIDLLHSRVLDYFKDLRCFFCNNIQESLEHLMSCPALLS